MTATILFELDVVVSTSVDFFLMWLIYLFIYFVTILLLCLILPLCLFYDISFVSSGVLVVFVGWLFVSDVFPDVDYLSADTSVTVLLLCLIPPLCIF